MLPARALTSVHPWKWIASLKILVLILALKAYHAFGALPNESASAPRRSPVLKTWKSETMGLQWRLQSSDGRPHSLQLIHRDLRTMILIESVIDEMRERVAKSNPRFRLLRRKHSFPGAIETAGTTYLRIPNTPAGDKFIQLLGQRIEKINAAL